MIPVIGGTIGTRPRKLNSRNSKDRPSAKFKSREKFPLYKCVHVALKVTGTLYGELKLLQETPMSSSKAGIYASSPTIIHPSVDVLLPQSYGPVTQGGPLPCDAVAWLVVENSVIIVDTVSGKVRQSWRPPPEAGRITHVAEFSLGDREFIVVGLDHNGCGVAVVLSPDTSKILRAFEISGCITSLHAFSSSIFASCTDGYTLPDLFQSSALEYFSGVVAVGCRGGKVYLINLHLNVGDHLSGGSYEFSKLCLVEESTSADEIHAIGERGQHACTLMTRGKTMQVHIVYLLIGFHVRLHGNVFVG